MRQVWIKVAFQDGQISFIQAIASLMQLGFTEFAAEQYLYSE